ncbi:hypothetical protein GFK82_00526 [Candidatus Steffania adelgidicola]|nr:hypothetical protein GFK82_00526 [Candidatus Steffania adelgidicola]
MLRRFFMAVKQYVVGVYARCFYYDRQPGLGAEYY